MPKVKSHSPKAMTNTKARSYDDWKLDCPPEMIQDELFRREVDGKNGILCWHIFTLINSQENAPDWAWKTCQKGPFTSLFAKAIFRIHVALAQLAGEARPLAVASQKAIHCVNPDYFDACSEIEDTWKERLSMFSLRAIQEYDYTINLYQCDTEIGEY